MFLLVTLLVMVCGIGSLGLVSILTWRYYPYHPFHIPRIPQFPWNCTRILWALMLSDNHLVSRVEVVMVARLAPDLELVLSPDHVAE